MKTDKRSKTFIRMIPTLSGEKRKYEFVSLSRREAVEVAHNSLTTLLSAVSTVASTLFSGEKTSESPESRKKIAENIVSAVSSIRFATLWDIAKPVLRGAVVDDVVVIDDLEKSDYYDDRIDEFYSALALGVEGNYPSVFSKVRSLLDGFDLPPDVKTKLGAISRD